MEQKKTGKYLKYAIGEIVLVVIGILIALSINNWNRDRLNRIESKTITASIYNDLVSDTLLLAQYINSYKNRLVQNDKCINKLKQDDVNFETFKQVAKEFDPTFLSIKSFNNTTLNAIESSGKIDLLDEQIKIKLLKYTNEQSISLDHTNEGLYERFFINFMSKYLIGNDHNKYIVKLNENIKDEQEYANLLTNLISYKSYLMKVSTKRWKRALERAREVITLIDASKL